MITGDLLRFVTIYAIFAMGFSQGKSKLVIVVVIAKAATERFTDSDKLFMFMAVWS